MGHASRGSWYAAAAHESDFVPIGLYAVRVELTDVITDEELRHELDANPFHWLLEFKPRLAQAASGGVSIDLTIPGPDVWTTILTTMAVLRQSGYDMQALHVETQEARDQQSAA